MSEEQKKLEKLLLQHIENQVVSVAPETVAETALALIELWKQASYQGSDSFIPEDSNGKHFEGVAIKNFKTCELVEELKQREGVETHWTEPYQDFELKVNGSAIVLVVTD